MNGPRRRILRRARTSKRGGIPLEVVRDRQARQFLAEDGDESEIRVVQRVEAVVEDAAERLEQLDVLEPAIAVRREPSELGEHALTGRLDHERGRRTQERLRALVHVEPELVFEAHGAEEAQRRQYADLVMAALRQAAAAGFRDAGKLQGESAFGVVRGREDFAELLADLQEGETTKDTKNTKKGQN